jgi:hypothetical protein
VNHAEKENRRHHLPLPGRWFVRYFVKVDTVGEEKERFTRMKHTATLTFEIPNEKKRPKASGH